MRTKTAYRQNSNSDISPDNFPEAIPEPEINGAEAAPVAAVSALPEPVAEPAPEAVAQAEAEAAKADEAKFGLLNQIQAMRRAEQIQKQQHFEYQRVALASQPQTRDQKLEAWRQQGMTAREALFLREHPTMIDHPEVASFAANEAIANGIERNSDSYWKAVEVNFDKAMSHLKARAEAMDPTPKFFEPPPARAPRKASTAIYSAPVSREAPSSTPRPVDPRRVELSAEETQIAAASGISTVEYAKNKLRLMKEKAEGTRQ